MSKFGALPDYSFTNGSGQSLNAALKNEEHRVLNLLDDELSYSQIVNFGKEKEYFYQSNIKTIELFQSSSDWTLIGSSTLSNDTTYNFIGVAALKILENDNTGSVIGAYRTITSINLNEFNDGSIAGNDDLIVYSCYFSNYTKFSNLTLKLGTDSSNYYYLSVTPSAIFSRNGYHTLFYKKTDFSSNGAPNWAAITYIELNATTENNSQNEYISFQLIQLVREDPDNPGYSQAFQKYSNAWNNYFEVNDDVWNLYNDPIQGCLGMQQLDSYSFTGNEKALHIYCEVISFIIELEAYCKVAGETTSITWYVDINNYIECFIASNILYLHFYEAAVLTSYTISLTNALAKQEMFNLYLEKDNITVRAILKKDGENDKILEANTSIASNQEGCVYFGNNGTYGNSFITDFIISNNKGYKFDRWNKPKLICKKVAEGVASSTILQNDDELFSYLPPNGVFEIELYVNAKNTVSSIPDIKIDWEITGDYTVFAYRYCQGPDITLSNISDVPIKSTYYGLTTAVTYGIVAGTDESIIKERFILSTGKNGAKIQMRWAQNTSNGSTVTVESGSFIRITKINM